MLDAALARGGGVDMFADHIREGMIETMATLCDAECVWLVGVDGLGHEMRASRGLVTGGAFTATMALQLGALACSSAEDLVIVPDASIDERLRDYRLETGDCASHCWIAIPMVGRNGKVMGSMNALREQAWRPNLTQRKALLALRKLATDLLFAAATLRHQQASMRELYLMTPLPLYVLDPDGHLLTVSQQFLDLLGYGADDVLGRNPRELMNEPSSAFFAREREQLWAAGGCRDLPCVFLRKDGQAVETLLSARVERDAVGHVVRALCAIVDVTRQNQLQRELERASRVDPLTGSWNRGWFLERLAVEVKRARRHQRPLSLVLLDIDLFKRVNDTWGHAAGDQVLQSVVGVARAQLRDHDEIGRLGGEEFGILLPETPVAGAMIVAERLRQGVANLRIDYQGEEIRTSISAGVGEVQLTELCEAALARVDAALYAAKRGGRDRIVVWGQSPSPLASQDGVTTAAGGGPVRTEVDMLF